MQDKDKILIENWILKSKESLGDTANLINLDMLSSAQNRLYYGLFYLVMALAQSKSFITSKHSSLLSWFNREFIKTEIFPIEMGKLYKTAYDNRQKSDYTITFKPDKTALEDSLNKANMFAEKIMKEIKKSL